MLIVAASVHASRRVLLCFHFRSTSSYPVINSLVGHVLQKFRASGVVLWDVLLNQIAYRFTGYFTKHEPIGTKRRVADKCQFSIAPTPLESPLGELCQNHLPTMNQKERHTIAIQCQQTGGQMIDCECIVR